MPVTHTCNSSYLGSRDQEDHSSKPSRTDSSQDPILKNTNTKRVGGVAQVIEHLLSIRP
jgi:hypothetical protein